MALEVKGEQKDEEEEEPILYSGDVNPENVVTADVLQQPIPVTIAATSIPNMMPIPTVALTPPKAAPISMTEDSVPIDDPVSVPEEKRQDPQPRSDDKKMKGKKSRYRRGGGTGKVKNNKRSKRGKSGKKGKKRGNYKKKKSSRTKAINPYKDKWFTAISSSGNASTVPGAGFGERSMFDDSDDADMGYMNGIEYELLCQGIKPWETEDALAAMSILYNSD